MCKTHKKKTFRPAITDSLQFIPYLFTCAGIICAYLGGGSTGSEYILEKGTKCAAPERDAAQQPRGKAWQDDAKPAALLL